MRRTISSGGPWEDGFGYSRAVRVGPWVAVSGTTAAAAGGGAVGGDDLAAQAREVLRRIAVALSQAGASLDDVIRTRIYLTDVTRWPEVAPVHREVFAGVRPAATLLGVTALIDPSLLVEIEADAYVAASGDDDSPAGG